MLHRVWLVALLKSTDANAVKIAPATGAVHSAEIEYAMGNLATNKVYAWTPDDYKVSEVDAELLCQLHKNSESKRTGSTKMVSR